MLKNFMDLVTATKLATMRTMYTSRIDDFNFYMKRYLDNVLILYPAVKLVPNQHLSLHYGYDLLPVWGPSHGYRGWITERMNYKLQRVPTNRKFGEGTRLMSKAAYDFSGELESTMSTAFRTAQQLHVMMAHGQLPVEPMTWFPTFTILSTQMNAGHF